MTAAGNFIINSVEFVRKRGTCCQLVSLFVYTLRARSVMHGTLNIKRSYDERKSVGVVS